MNAPVSEQVKAEAAKSLLERMAEKTKLVRFFRYNASAKHGVPIDDEKDIVITPDTPQEQVPRQESVPAQNIVQIVKTDEDSDERIKNLEREIEHQRQLREQEVASTATTQEPSSKMNDKVKGILQTLAVLGGLGAAGLAGYALSNGESDTKENKSEVNLPYYSPYQYLEDTGEHLP